MKKLAYYYKNSSNEYIQIYAQKAHYLVNHQGWKNRFFAFPHQNSIEVVVKISGKGTYFYAFMSDQDQNRYEALGGGESRAHYLFKTVLCEIDHITLKSSHWSNDVPISFSNMRPEHQVYHEGNDFYIDVYGNFKSDNILSFRWGPNIGIEICHTNKVHPAKKKALRALNIPIIEHKICDSLSYKGPEDYQDEQREERYKNMLRNKLNGGFLRVNVLSDPKSFEYLEWENKKLSAQLNDIRSAFEATQIKLNNTIRSNNNLASTIQDKDTRISYLETKISYSNAELSRLNSSVEMIKNMGWLEFLMFKWRSKKTANT